MTGLHIQPLINQAKTSTFHLERRKTKSKIGMLVDRREGGDTVISTTPKEHDN
jgi:hypothetical protein